MDLLSTAVVDITTLAATCHALAQAPGAEAPAASPALPRRLRRQLRREMKRGTLAYIQTLARAKPDAGDEALLAACRTAAERHMPRALEHQAPLREILHGEAGALDGLAATRQDLWRLARLALHLRLGVEALRGAAGVLDAKALDKLAPRLRRRLRKALNAYARATLRRRLPQERRIATARRAALGEIGKSGATLAERLADLEAGSDARPPRLRLGVCRPLFDLALDWRRDAPARG